jgi:hypothetical protein
MAKDVPGLRHQPRFSEHTQLNNGKPLAVSHNTLTLAHSAVLAG